MPSLILVDGGLGQLHAAAEALESLGLTSQPLASIAKREEVIYLYGNEDEPVVLDRRSPVLHLVQLIRDESHRFAVGYHRQRRAMRDRDSELLNIPGVGAAQMKLSGNVLGEIFLGHIKNWSDPRIHALNPSLKLPNLPITVVHRADGSGTSFIFTSYLSVADQNWSRSVGASDSVNWPTGLGGKGNDGVAAFV